MPERIHYIPRFILRQFKDDGRSLLEWNKLKGGTASARGIDVAAQRFDFWPSDIERGVMERMDNRTEKILRKKVWAKQVGDSIDLLPDERHHLAQWFGLWMIRTPNGLGRVSGVREQVLLRAAELILRFPIERNCFAGVPHLGSPYS